MPDNFKGALTRRRLLGTAAFAGTMFSLTTPARAALLALDAPQGGATFPLIAQSRPAGIVIDAEADSAVRHVADSFASDLERVSGVAPKRYDDGKAMAGTIVLIAVLGQSKLVDRLIASGKLKPGDLHGQWEAFHQIHVEHPFPGVSQALVILGSDRRGAVFGTYDLSERIGVSPWHWFADVPVERRDSAYVEGRRSQPKVRYRGFFINDEDPCFSGWAKKHFGGINSALYAHVFELLLRMKGNYLWPAMWAPKAFADDDRNNQILADAMGVVMGSSHHEVMMRAQDEWHRHTDQGVTGGPWDYEKNAANLRKFWRGGIERMMSKGDGKGYESVVTIGMRGDGDEAMAAGTATSLLERIVADQRQIIAEVTGKPASETPQVWALYKEVQDYYDHGMRVPDDVTLLFSDDNWGQIRRLPAIGAKPRKGGYGIYYHTDYVGGPRNYKWINSSQIEKIWQQMDLAYRRDARAMWIVNVGDIKGQEFPLNFFLDLAWDPEAMTPEVLAAYPARWASLNFGARDSEAIGQMMTAYGQYAARRKAELTDETSFALGGVRADGLDGGEFGAMLGDWERLERQMLDMRARLPADRRDTFDQILNYPVSAMTNLYRMYYAAAWNQLLASRNDPRANVFADQVEAAFRRDSELTAFYHAINHGKWDGMMAQVHMSYVSWNDPKMQVMPKVSRVATDTPADTLAASIRFVAPAPAVPGVITIDAPDFTRAHNAAGLQWTTIPKLGHTKGAVLALPQARAATSAADGVRLDYDVHVAQAGPARLTLVMAPSLDTSGTKGLRLGVSLDDGPMQTVVADLEPTGGDADNAGKQRWTKAVCDNAMRVTADLGTVTKGAHVLKVWRLDDNVVLQRLVLATVEAPPAYL